MINKAYLIMVRGVLFDRKLTQAGAMKIKKYLELKGYQCVSIAYELNEAAV